MDTENFVQEVYGYQLDSAFIEDKLINLKNQSRWNNVRIDGINERLNETWEDCEEAQDTLFKESLDIKEELVIERARRVKTDKNEKSNTPRTNRLQNFKI